jgi:Transposase DDE domain/Domain of unknown function (DUF4372)
MALILLSFEHREVFRDRRRASAMRHQDSVFQSLLKGIPWREFERLLAEHGADKDGRDLTGKAHLIAMLFAQLSGSAGLREIEAGLSSHAGQLYHLGGSEIRRSTLAEANRYRPAAIFTDLFAVMTRLVESGLRRKIGSAIRLIDSTVIPLSNMSRRWAQFSAKLCGVKAHLMFDPDAERPTYLQITAAKVNDIVVAKDMPIEPGTDYVFDLGYYEFRWWAEIDKAGSRFVTRLKINSPFALEEDRAVLPGSQILSDRVGYLSKRLAGSRKNPMGKLVREIWVRIDTGATLRLVTNDLAAPAQEIADLYKRRWAIELFFRWIKQTLKIRHFFGTSENAIRIQIATALITFLLLRMAQNADKIVDSPLTFARLIRANLMHRRQVSRLLRPPPMRVPDPRQCAFGFGPLMPIEARRKRASRPSRRLAA